MSAIYREEGGYVETEAEDGGLECAAEADCEGGAVGLGLATTGVGGL